MHIGFNLKIRLQSIYLINCFIINQGETQAYTLGDIGGHRCVVTKLPMTGHTREVGQILCVD